MSNPNADRIAALSRQEGTPEAEVNAAIATQYLLAANDLNDEPEAAKHALDYAKQWLSLIAETDEPTEQQKAYGLALQNLLSSKPTPASQPFPIYRAPLARLLVAVAEGNTTNPNPTPSFGSL